MISCHPIFDNHAFDAILGHITVLDEIYRSWRSCTLIPIYETYIETMIYSLSLRWFLSRASWELPSLACTSQCFDVIMLSFRETPLWSMDLIQLYGFDLWMTWIAHSMTDALSSSGFSDLSHIWCHAGAYSSISIEICSPPSIYMITLDFWDTHRVDDSISLCPDTPWSLSWVSQPDSRFLM